MSHQSESEGNDESKDAGVDVSPWRTLFRLARPLRARILIIIFLAALSTGATLIEPLVYRVAVNDVAGLFVCKAQEQTDVQYEEISALTDSKPPNADVWPVAYQIKQDHVTTGRDVENCGASVSHRRRV